MKKKPRNRFGLTIKSRLLLLCLAVLSIPYAGMQYLQQMEQFLQDSLEQSLIDSARALSGPLHEHPELFHLAWDNNQPAIFIHDIKHAIQVDGYVDDWKLYLDWSNDFLPSGQETNPDAAPKFRSLLARYDNQIFILLQVDDDQVLYNTPDQEDSINGDSVSLVFKDRSGQLQTYYFAPEAPGAMFPYQLQEYRPDDPYFEFSEATVTRSYITNIRSDWQQTEQGYVLEIRLPEYLPGDHLGFIVTDVYSENGIRKSLTTGSAGMLTASLPNLLLQPSRKIESIIQQHKELQGRRVWVLDQKGQVLAVAGDLKPPVAKASTNLLYEWLLPDTESRFRDDLAGRSRLEGEEIQSALSGNAGLRWRTTDRDAVIISAAVPVWSGNVVQGVVMVEETSHRIQLVQREAMTHLFNKTFLVFLVVSILLLLFAVHLSMRLRKLAKRVDETIDAYGRVSGRFETLGGNDEITDLSYHYADIVDRLQQYHDYLEGLSGKLSHELRTPMAVVQSSLENLQSEFTDQGKESVYVERAQEGVRRLNMLVTRLSEAARIEQSIQSSETESVDLNEFTGNCIEEYRQVWKDQEFIFIPAREFVQASISQELFKQMLDKLIANAVDFSSDNTAVEVTLKSENDAIILSITNYGSVLPENMQDDIFNSMISKREKKGEQPHLGLGLYIARLIAEFHGGSIHAENLVDKKGVRFSVTVNS